MIKYQYAILYGGIIKEKMFLAIVALFISLFIAIGVALGVGVSAAVFFDSHDKDAAIVTILGITVFYLAAPKIFHFVHQRYFDSD